MRKISADRIYLVTSDPVEEGVIVVDGQGEVLEIGHRADYDRSELEIYAGVIVPGFINTHCHLELSHMKGLIDTGTGLLAFIEQVVKYRDFPPEVIQSAIAAADREMYENGIVAVGDISNKTDTADQKAGSPIRYYTFVEMFDFLDDDRAEKTFAAYRQVYEGQSSEGGNRKSCVPHAPYTVSKRLFELINQQNGVDDLTISIHNQETLHEDRFFLEKSGGFLNFFEAFDIPVGHFQATGRPSIHYALTHMDATKRTLFVHNTMSGPGDIRAAHAWGDRIYWATCPNANLYIENRLPDYRVFIEQDARLTIGTDSLTSNWQLSVLEELKTIARYQSYLSFDTLLRWATLNGAEALGFADRLGSIEPGKQPGLNLLVDFDLQKGLTGNTAVRRVV